jgi:hypothetical protein
MAHFAEIDDDNIVLRVLVIPNEQENRGQEYLAEDLGLGGTWLKTSYNSLYGIYYDPVTGEPADDQTKLYRYTFAGIGFIYDPVADEFRPPQEEPTPA